MNPPVPKSERRLARWLLGGLALVLVPIIAVGVSLLSMFRLSREAAILRREVAAASNSDWTTKVQLSAGWGTLTTVRTVLRFIDHEHVDEARLALASVRRASVGVYERNGHSGKWSREQLLAKTDERMRARGWSRLVGVTEDDGEAVLIYSSNENDGDEIALCLAVLDGSDLVVVSTSVDGDKLANFAEKHLPKGELREKLRHGAAGI